MWKGEKMIVMGGIMTLNNKNIALFLKDMRAGTINCESTWAGQFYRVENSIDEYVTPSDWYIILKQLRSIVLKWPSISSMFCLVFAIS